MDCVPGYLVRSRRSRSPYRQWRRRLRPRSPYRWSLHSPEMRRGLSTCWQRGPLCLVGFCVSRFARLSASPGSLYTYTASTLPPLFGVTAALALLVAYLGIGASVAGGALYYTNLLALQFLHFAPPAIPTLAVVCLAAGFVAYRDVKLSAELMLWIEVASVGLIIVVLAVMLVALRYPF